MLLYADKSFKLLSLLLGLCLSISICAQHAPVNAQYLSNALPMNPAFAGSREALSIALTYRNQWSAIDGAPVTQTLAIHSPTKNEKLAFGLLIYRDAIGVSKKNAFMANMAYRVKLGAGKLAFGLSGGMVMQSNEWSKVHTTGLEIDEVFIGGDDRFNLPDFGAGVFYSSQKWFVSLSTPSLMQHKYAGGQAYNAEFDMASTSIFGAIGARLKLNRNLKLQPSILVRSLAGDTQQLDFNLIVNYNEILEIGASYRTSNAFLSLLRYHLNGQFSLAYSNEIETGTYNNYFRMSHEITLTYDLIFKTNSTSPKFF